MKKRITLFLLLVGSFFTSNIALANELLPPDQAFKFDAVVEGNSIKATWTSADDYYMYRAKFGFKSETNGTELGEAEYPKGKMKHGIKPDGTEGEVETFGGSVSINVPIKASAGGSITLVALGQGCAEKLGVCYPPQKRKFEITLPVIAKASAATSTAVSGVQSLSSQLGLDSTATGDDPLPPSEAFIVDTRIVNNMVHATWTVANDYYMYRDKFGIESNTPGVSFGKADVPAGKLKHGIRPDGTEGEVETFSGSVTIKFPILASQPGITSIAFAVLGQGCAETLGICYPPQKRPQSLTAESALPIMIAAAGGEATETKSIAPKQTGSDKEFVSEQDKATQILASGETIEIIFYFFLGGLALAFTACMYPMIPILSSIIVGQGEKVTTVHAFNLSLFYVLSMAVTFGVMGAAFAGIAKGINLQAVFQSPWILVPFSLVFVLLAMSMFGFYSIQMPASFQGKLSQISSSQKGGSYIGVIIMGALSALIIGPCAGPVIIGALAYVASEGDVFLGFLSMFVMGLGLGLPLMFVGTSHGKFLPKAGGWMDTVKYAAGVVLLAIALLFLERVSFMPAMLIMLLWSALLIIAGIYMGALDQIKEGASGWHKLWKGLGLVFILYGAVVMLGGLTGARNVSDPMHGSKLTMGGGSQHAQAELGFKHIKTAEDLQRELDQAKALGKFVMLDFYADWCTYCKEFEDYVFTDPNVQSLLADFVLIQADVTANDKQDQSLLNKTGVIAPPAILFWDKDGNEKSKYRIIGAMDAKQFIDHVNLILKGN